jgi:hypothetical protein
MRCAREAQLGRLLVPYVSPGRTCCLICSCYQRWFMLASQFGYDLEYRFAYGALLVESGQSGLATAAAIAVGALIAIRISRDDARGLAHAMFVTLALVLEWPASFRHSS